MKQIITAKLKLLTTAEQYRALRQTQLAYRDALNAVSQYAFEHGKTSNNKALHRAMYLEARVRYGLPSQLACSVMRQVTATYRGLWTKLKKNCEHRRKKITTKRFKGLDKPPKYTSPTVTYQYGRDFGFKQRQQVSVQTLEGRIELPYQGYNEHLALIREGATFGDAKLWYDERHRRYFLLVSLELELADPTPDVQRGIVGVDVGQRYLATTAALTEQQHFFTGKAVRAKADHCARLRKQLQRKGTRSATRRLRLLSGRERRLKLNINHVIAKSIIEQHPCAFIGIEDLTGIRERARHPKRRRKGKKAQPLTPKQRCSNRHASQWAFAELQAALAYKAAICGSIAVRVDADYTSQACPMCGYADEKNRPGKGLLFICQNPDCVYKLRMGRPYRLHADLVGARNIAMRALLIRQDWVRTGVLSIRPDGSDREAKAERLKRYSGLRWSSDPSSRL